MSSLTTEIGKRVRGLREHRGFTTSDLAFKVGMSQAQISRLENGRQGFRTETLKKIAGALEVEIGYLVSPISDSSSALVQAMRSPEFRQAVESAAAQFMRGEQEEAVRSLQ